LLTCIGFSVLIPHDLRACKLKTLQAVCSRYGLSIGGHAAPAVQLLMWLTAPISWPIGKALDWMLGKENVTFGKRQIRALVDLHRWAALTEQRQTAWVI
jgi:CBS domain containing-hemolysin-like protein